MYKALDIAKWFIHKNDSLSEESGGEKITLLKLLKLLYYAEGSSLALGNGSLFDEDIIAWEHGPVVREVYDYYSSNPYCLEFDCENDVKSINSIFVKDKNILDQVFDEFGSYSAWALRNKTHEEDPWKNATNGGKRLNRIIPREEIQKYFKENYVE